MTTRIGNVVLIEREKDTDCAFCHKHTECRPYGPGGKQICFDCAQLHVETVHHNMNIILFGDPGNIK